LPSLFQVVGYSGDDDIFPVKQRCADPQAGLVVEKVVPPFFRHELRDDASHLVIRLLRFAVFLPERLVFPAKKLGFPTGKPSSQDLMVQRKTSVDSTERNAKKPSSKWSN
jgi:hypothetical protein